PIMERFTDYDGRITSIAERLIAKFLHSVSLSAQAQQCLDEVFPDLRFTREELETIIARMRPHPQYLFVDEEKKLNYLRSRFIQGYVTSSGPKP
ncbi:MAG: hypothetical protein Q8K36_03045, partial [Alphaproteobacteria bacterium]|nr:hypothetical protein [Alphaproteobacteria bacterium]